MILTVRGRKIKVHGDGAALRRMYEKQYAELTNEQLDAMEADDFPDRGILRDALNAVYKAEDLCRQLLFDELSAAGEKAAQDPDFVPDYWNVNPELDTAVSQLFETGLTLRELLNES